MSNTPIRLRPILRPCFRCLYSTASSTPPAPPLLLKLRGDLKTAMREKDGNKLNVLRSLLSEVANQSKTSNPIKTDMQLLSLLRKKATAAKEASQQFAASGRSDLQEKENAQASVLDDYVGGVNVMSDDEIRTAIAEVQSEMEAKGEKVDRGPLLRILVGPGGKLDGKQVDKASVAKIVGEMLKS